MEFQKMLLTVQDFISRDELQDLIFLCSDLLSPNKLSMVSSATELFKLLETSDLFSPEDSSLLIELLTITKQHSLIRTLCCDGCTENTGTERISSYRKMLFDLSQCITDAELKNIKFMLGKTLARRKLEQDMTLLQLFSEMEKESLLDENNLKILQKIIGNVYPALRKRIIQYTTEREMFSSQNTVPMENIPTQASSGTLPSPAQFTLHTFQSRNDSHDQSQHLELNSVIENKHPQIHQYEMKRDRRGVCVIINNCDFSADNMKRREGTDIDKESLKAVFQWLGFEVQTEQNCNRKRMLKVLNDLGSQDHTEADCVVCCVLSHGYLDGVFGVDGEKVNIRELMDPLNPFNCPSLLQKPKLFFIQACRGTKKQRAVWQQTKRDDEMTVSDAVVPRDSIPEAADYLLAMSTVPHYEALRDIKKGSWFMQSLCDNLKLLVPRGVDLITILTQVNHDVSKKTDGSGVKKQVPQPEFTLTRRVVFPVPETPPPLE